MNKEITKDTKIGDLLEKYPETAQFLFEAGIHCVGCHMAAHESLEQGMKAHGLSGKQVDEVIRKINRKIHKEKE